MTFFQALILGIVQGITEFFPISSSAHLRLFKNLMHIPDGEHLLYFDLLCHAGTLLAVIIYLRKEVFLVLASMRKIGLFFLALLPLVPAYFLLKPVRIALSDPMYLGYFLLVTALILFSASFIVKKNPPKTIHALWIGMAQALALIPGISRSGSTIAVARFCGWTLKEGALFSFLLAIPTILGGELLETIQLLKSTSASIVPWTSYAAGFLASFGSGLFSCRTVFWIYERGLIRPFAWYCLTVGLIALLWLRN
ncbi:MAG TPA: undecaprenyl-diphosphate phosphatase [Chlamydiales bacterium]|nr:undecaprenyl-diphosphate phosphatase [Chlamydiales bacterium]